MHIFVSHSTHFDFKNELYAPLRNSALTTQHEFFFPHDTEIIFNTKGAIQNVYELVLAEVSFASTGQGIELGWADDANKKIVCIYRKGASYSFSLNEITDIFIEYSNTNDMISKLSSVLEKFD